MATDGGSTTLPDDQLHGPVVTMKIVGVIRMPIDSVLTFATEPELYPSPGFYAQHRDQMAIYFTNALVRLRHGAADLPAFLQHVTEVYGRDDIPVKDLSDDVKRVQNSTDLERTALLLFAAAAALGIAGPHRPGLRPLDAGRVRRRPGAQRHGPRPARAADRAGPAPRARGRHGGRVGGRDDVRAVRALPDRAGPPARP